jgi:ABC-2 type transport system ATP-binding protein
MAPIISVEDVRVSYGGKTALDGVSLDIDEGSSFALLGPNGAGKTTLINILCTLRPPERGRALIAGYDVARQPRRARRSIGVVFQNSSLDDRLTAYENLEFHGLVHGLPSRQRRLRVAQVLELVTLTEWQDEIVRDFSGGMRRRLEIARALMHDPKILFLDEPTVGLDVQTRQQIWHYLARLRVERPLTTLTTTHYIEEVEGADVVCIIDHGKIIAKGAPGSLKQEYGRRWLQADAIDSATQQEILAFYPKASPLGAKSVIVPTDVADAVDFQTGPFNGRLTEIRYREPTLESVFLSLTGRDLRDRADGEREAQLAEGRRGGRR